MKPITNLDDLVSGLKGAPPRRLAVAAGHDPHTLEAAMRAAAEGLARVTLVADARRLAAMAADVGPLPAGVTVVDEPDPVTAAPRMFKVFETKMRDSSLKSLATAATGSPAVVVYNP